MLVRRSILALAILCLAAGSSARSGADPLRAFVTSASGSADFSSWPQATSGLHGIAAADSICQDLASQASLPNPSQFVAWLSDSTTDAWCHVQGLAGTRDSSCNGAPTLPGAGPWARPGDSSAWSGDLAALTDHVRLYLPLSVREDGTPLVGFPTRTGTDATGRALSFGDDFCQNWTNGTDVDRVFAYGVTNTVDGGWTNWGTHSDCSNPNFHLYCVQAAAGPALRVGSDAPGGVIFLTGFYGDADLDGWFEAGGQTGVAAADAICRYEAAQSFLPRPTEYVAWISDGVLHPASRVPAGIAWNRPDTYTVAASTADLAAGSILTGPTEDAAGGYFPSLPGDSLPIAWTGLDDSGNPAATNCSLWSSSSSGDTGGGGLPTQIYSFWQGTSSPWPCNFPGHVVCLSTFEALFWDNFESGDLARWSSAAP